MEWAIICAKMIVRTTFMTFPSKVRVMVVGGASVVGSVCVSFMMLPSITILLWNITMNSYPVHCLFPPQSLLYIYWWGGQGFCCAMKHCLPLNSYSASHDNWCTATLWNRIMTAQCEGMGEVGSARYEPALLPPCPSVRVLSYSNCQEIHPFQQTGLAV